MRLFKFWIWLLSPPKFYGGGGGGTTTTYQQDNPQQQALANVANQKYDYYQAKYVPLENQWMDTVSNMNNQANHNDVAGMATNTLKQSQGPQTQSAGDSMTGGRLQQGNYYDMAGAESNSASKADMGVTNRMLQGQEGIVAMGQGQSAGAINGLTSVAEQSVQGQNTNASNVFDRQQSINGTYGTGLGMAAAAGINKYGSN